MRKATIFHTLLGVVFVLGFLTEQCVPQTVTPFPTAWVQSSGRFFKLSSDGSKVLVNRFTSDKEELVLLPTGGGQDAIYVTHSSVGAKIYSNFDLSGDATTVVFAPAAGDRLYCVKSPGGNPGVVASVAPDKDITQITLSTDGRWVAFTASRVIWTGNSGRVNATLYVAATDGTALYKINQTPLVGKNIAYDFSSDGGTVVWVDDVKKGPMVADRDGTNATRLPFPPEVDVGNGGIRAVYCNPTGSTIFYDVLEWNGTALDGKLFQVNRDKTGLQRRDILVGGTYEVARGGVGIRVYNSACGPSFTGSCWLLGEQGNEKMFDFGCLGWGAGTYDWSYDGNVLIWYDERPRYDKPVMVWKKL